MAFGRGKVILLGEHSVVYGQPALAAGIGRGVTAHATVVAGRGRDQLRIDPWNTTLRLGDGPTTEALAEAFQTIRAGYPAGRSVEVVAEVALPSAAGLGCSAALGVAVVGALDEVFGVTRTPEERGSVALAWERVFHGNPSGIDNTMAACGGVAVYRRGHPLVPVSLPGPLWLVLASSGEPSSTKAMVEGVARLHRRSPETTEKTFDAIGVLVEEARDALEASRLARVGQLMNLNQTLLSSLLLSTARLEEMCEVARNSGALGAKLTGAGGGGCIVALVPDHAHAETVCEALTAAGSEAFTAAVGEQPAEGPTAGGQTA